MMKINNVVKKESIYIAIWVIILSTVMEAVFLIIGKWDFTVLLGNVFVALLSVLNFFLMGITVQYAVEKEGKARENYIRISQILRNLLIFIVVVICVCFDCFNLISSVITLVFPRLAIAIRPLFDKKKV